MPSLFRIKIAESLHRANVRRATEARRKRERRKTAMCACGARRYPNQPACSRECRFEQLRAAKAQSREVA
jgi:hypothetical protein